MVNVFFYNRVNDYINKNLPYYYSINVKELDFIRYLVALGSFYNKSISSDGIEFYYHLVKMAFDTRNGVFKISNDYYNSESSIKTAISYFIGSISVFAIAEKEYNLSYLFHLKDPVIDKIMHYNPNNKKFPDYVGFYNNNFNSAFLIEAKGTYKSRLSKNTVIKAKSQVNSISSLDLKLNNSSQTISNFHRHVIGSYFKNRELNFCDIDPEEAGELVCKFDTKSNILMYYKNIMFLLLINFTGRKEINVEKLKYIVVDFNGYKIGLNSDLFNYLIPYYSLDKYNKLEIYFDYQERNNDSDLFLDIFSISSEMYNNEDYLKVNQSMSLGRDGIIVM